MQYLVQSPSRLGSWTLQSCKHICEDFGFLDRLAGLLLTLGCSGTGRDKKGLLFQLLLPVAAICLVLAILKVNIDPSSPTITLKFMDMLQQQPVYVANAPPGLSPCIVKATGSAQQDTGPCRNALHFRCAHLAFIH